MTAGDGATAALTAEGPGRVGPFRLTGRLGADVAGRIYPGSSAEDRIPAFNASSGGRADVEAPRAAICAAIDCLEVPPLECLLSLSGPLTCDQGGELPDKLDQVPSRAQEASAFQDHPAPPRVLMSRAEARSLAFGIAGALDSTSSDGSDLATSNPGDLCVEEFLGTDVTAATDVYTLSTVLHYAPARTSPLRFSKATTASERVASYQHIVPARRAPTGLSGFKIVPFGPHPAVGAPEPDSEVVIAALPSAAKGE
ncbi:hypothetical protein [Streptomyces sp. NPDC056670]|uniref:hypothetical protein n=1 Tax=Streptomyces sp. NPDC056670 TaxID=3345904 RepID=UPI00368C138C